MTALLNTNLGATPLLGRGKVRDLYALGDNLLFVATDRISAFDHVLGSGIPDKGAILTQISAFWFEYLKDTVANHLLATEPAGIAALLEPFSEIIFGEALTAALIQAHPTFQQQIAGRSMVAAFVVVALEAGLTVVAVAATVLDVAATGAVCGIALPPGLRESDKLPEPIFTPAAKINTGGHDENISYAQVEAMVGVQTAAELRRLTLAIYAKAAVYAAARGLILADTKFEFGVIGDAGLAQPDGLGIVLADPHPGLLPILASRRLRAGWTPAQLRQAVCARLSGVHRMEQAGSRTQPASGCRRPYPGKIYGRVSPAHGAQ